MRRKKRHKQEEVELNLCAMLDMAFQLLTFFILTFRPAPVEGQILLRMPPPMPVTNINAGQKAGSDTSNTNPVQGLNTLIITAIADGSGDLRQMAIGDISLGSLPALERKLSSVFADPGNVFDQVIVQVDSRLKYEALMGVIDVCTRQKLPSGEPLSKLSFVELPAGGG
jgi:biopolymer transport protein ExbD